jgi:serine/threonine-protein kinase
VLAVIALVAGLLVQNSRGEKVDLTSVVGQPVANAQSQITGLGLTVETVAKNDENCRKDTVTQQDPVAGTKVEKNSKVTLTVCAGPNTSEVPDLRGATRQAAEDRLKDLHLKADIETVNSKEPKDIVLSVDKAGQSVPFNTVIKVRVSNNLLTEVPDVVGQKQDVAEGILRQAGFNVRVQDGQPVTDPAVAGQVSDQNPGARKDAKRGDTVTIKVSVLREPDDEPTPDDSGSPGPGGPGGNNGTIGGILPGLGGGGNPIIGQSDREHRR